MKARTARQLPHDIRRPTIDPSGKEQRQLRAISRQATSLSLSLSSATLEHNLQSKPKVPFISEPADGRGTCDLTKAVQVGDIAIRIVLNA